MTIFTLSDPITAWSPDLSSSNGLISLSCTKTTGYAAEMCSSSIFSPLSLSCMSTTRSRAEMDPDGPYITASCFTDVFTSTSHSASSGLKHHSIAIIGGSVGGLSVLVVMAVALQCWRRRRQRYPQSSNANTHSSNPSTRRFSIVSSTSSAPVASEMVGSPPIDSDLTSSLYPEDQSQAQSVNATDEPPHSSAKQIPYANALAHPRRLSRMAHSS